MNMIYLYHNLFDKRRKAKQLKIYNYYINKNKELIKLVKTGTFVSTVFGCCYYDNLNVAHLDNMNNLYELTERDKKYYWAKIIKGEV